MLIERDSLNFKKVEFYTYEIIPKEETNRFLQNFDESALRKKEGSKTKFSTTVYGRDFTSVTHEWDLKDGLEKCWERIDEFDQFKDFENMDSYSVMSKPHVKQFQLFLIENPHLPYDFMIIKIILDEKKAKEITDSNEQLNILLSINDYMKRFCGIIDSTAYGGKDRPSYLKYEIDVDDSDIKSITEQIKILKENREFKKDEEIDRYYEASKELRITHFDPKEIDYKMMTGSIKGKSFSVLGFMDGLGDEIKYNNYEITFNPKNKILFWARNTSFKNEIDYDFSNQLHFVSISIFLTHILRKLDDYEVEFSTLISEYKKLKEKNTNQKKELYHKLTNFEEELFFIESDLEKIEFVLKTILNNSINEIHTYNLMSPKQKEKEYYFSDGTLKTIFKNSTDGMKQVQSKLSNIQKKETDLKNKFEKDIIFENTISMKENSNRNWILSLSMLVVSSIIAAQIIYDFFTSGS